MTNIIIIAVSLIIGIISGRIKSFPENAYNVLYARRNTFCLHAATLD